MHRPIRRLAALLILALPAAGPAKAEELSVAFDVRYGNLLVSRMSLAANVEDDRYTARGIIRDAGFVGAFFDLTFDGTASGWLRNGRPVPQIYNSVSDDGNTRREVRIRYAGGRPVEMDMDPPPRDREYTLDPRDQAGALDPISTAWSILSDKPEGDACGRSIEVFDGRRLNRIDIEPARGGAGEILCDGAFVRVAGYSEKALAEGGRFPFTLHLRRVGDGQVQVDRLEIQTVYGRLNAWRR